MYAEPVDRRTFVRTAGLSIATTTALAGCSTALTGTDETTEYALTVHSVDAAPTEHALYEPDDGDLFGAPAWTALDAILPDGRHTTYGYEPLPTDAYVAHDGAYYQTKSVVTGRERVARSLVGVDRVPEGEVPDDAVLVDSLAQPSARVVKILHSHTVSEGGSTSADLLRGDSYVLRRPAERESRLATGDLDGRVVTMTPEGTWAYRVRVRSERVVEPAHTAFAVRVADSRAAFREVVFAARVDVELAPDDLPAAVRDRLERTIGRNETTATTPLPESFVALLDALDLRPDDATVNGRLLWYDGRLSRYGLYSDDPA